jgi:hypothetical protein
LPGARRRVQRKLAGDRRRAEWAVEQWKQQEPGKKAAATGASPSASRPVRRHSDVDAGHFKRRTSRLKGIHHQRCARTYKTEIANINKSPMAMGEALVKVAPQ